MKFAKNPRHSLNCGNSSLRSSNTPQFLTLIPRFSSPKFHEAVFFLNALGIKPKTQAVFFFGSFLLDEQKK